MNFENKVISSIIPCLPYKIRFKLNEMISTGELSVRDMTEVRLRVGRKASVTCGGVNHPFDLTVDGDEMMECVTKFCRGSVYAHDSTMRLGYIRFENGVRIGVCGIFSPEGKGVREITSVNIRLPHIIRGVSDKILEACRSSAGINSFLIYSPPGVGKTTLLRDIAAKLSGEYKYRTAIIDTRGELYIEDMFKDGICDVLVGYPRGMGIEIATRTLSPEVIICDELGNSEEAKGILEAQNTGVPIIASAHGGSLDELLRRPNIRLLHENGVFSGYVGISRALVNGQLSHSYSFQYTRAEEMKA